MATKKKKSSTKTAKKKRITVSFTWSGLFSTAVLIVLSIIWAFILGILVGRGYSPDSLFPKLAGLLPQKDVPATTETTASKDDQVLKPEELGFFETLQQGGQQEQTAGGTQAEEKAAGTRKEQRHKQSAPAAGQSSGTQYRYVYQVAAFRSADKAYSLQNNLRSKGIDSQVSAVRVDEREWYRLVVPFEGQPQETAEFKSELKRLGLHQPLLRSKKRIGSE
jgi:cell division protein FtsN